MTGAGAFGVGPSGPRFVVARSSVGLDLAEAVRAVDRPVHPRLEGHLGLVAARRADHREVLAGDPIIAALVAAGPTDFTDVVARVAAGAAAGPTACASLGVGREPLLRVVLLVGRRVNELHPTVDAVQRPIGIGHQSSSPLRCSPIRLGRGHRRAGRCEERRGGRRRAIQVPMWSPCIGAHRCVVARPYIGPKNPALRGLRRAEVRPDLPVGGIWRP